MDQDAFRNLLASTQRSQLNTKQGAANGIPKKVTTPTLSGPAFKPHKVKKAEGKYRNRAAERREGVGNDYASAEAVLEDFEKRLAHEDKDVIEEQRKYLGGDSQHTILVKGLDMSLLEQNRARATASTEDDEILEQAFVEATSTSEPSEPRKRTREDIIRDLKAKRQNEDKTVAQPVVEKPPEADVSALEAAKKAGKFRPIGQSEERPKKRKVKEGKEGVKKKKQKVGSAPIQSATKDKPAEATQAINHKHHNTEPSSSKTPKKPPEPEPEPLDEDLDIFAGVGDYGGFANDEESEEEYLDTGETRTTPIDQAADLPVPAVGTKGWFNEPDPLVRFASPPEKPPPVPETIAAEEEQEEMRLKPLESSALPSIRDFLAMDEAVEKAEKRKARKEKEKKKKKSGEEDDD